MSPRSRKPRGEGRGGAPARPVPKAPAGLARLLALGPGTALALVLCAGLILQFPALGTPFFADDYLFLDQVGRASLVQTLSEPDPIGNFYRPVGRQLYFWLVARATGGSAPLFHAANLALWLALLALLFAVARRLAGARAGLIAAGMLALHYAADAAVRWGSGCQDLLAITGALGALWLHLTGRGPWAGVALLGALLSKEVVALTPLIAVVAARGKGESWRAAALRAWPLFAAVLAWALIVWGVTHARPGGPEKIGVTVVAAAAALAHMCQVVAGIEWYGVARSDIRPVAAWAVSVALVLLAIGAHGRRGARVAPEAGAAGNGRGLAAGLVWMIAGAAPVTVVASSWSAYYYLFALCGAGIVLGVLLARRHPEWAMLVLALLAWNSGRASGLDANALVREPWTTCSRINRHYIERGTRMVQRYLRHLLAARPTLPPRSTLFFGGVPGAVAFQTADGPLVRWAYRDTSLRSYYINSFDLEKARRGPYLFFEVRRDSLIEKSDPNQFYRMALGAILSDKPASAREMLQAQLDRDSTSVITAYWMAWVVWDLGERERAYGFLRKAGLPAAQAASPAPEIASARAAIARRDTVAAWRMMQRAVTVHMLEAEVHAMLSDLTLLVARDASGSVVEAYAARLLAPESPGAWRRWAMAQVRQDRPLEGARSLRRYFDLAGEAGTRDLMAQETALYLRAKYPVTIRALEGRDAP